MQLTQNMKIGIGVAAVAAAILGWSYMAKAEGIDRARGKAAHQEAEEPVVSKGLSIYVGGHGGMSFANTELTTPLIPGLSLDGVGANGWIGGAHAGVDYKFAAGPSAFAGVFGGYDFQSTESSLTVPNGPATAKFSAGLGDSYYLGGRLGYDWGKYKAYALAAYRHTDVEWGVPSGVVIPKQLGLPSSMNGVDLGIGAAMMIAPNVELGVEGVWTKYQKENVTYDFGGQTGVKDVVGLETEQLSAMARLSFKFGAN